MQKKQKVILGIIILISIFAVYSFVRKKRKEPSPVQDALPFKGIVLAYFSYSNEGKNTRSLEKYGDKLDVLSPSWFRYETNGAIKGKGYDPEVAAMAKKKKLLLVPLLTNYDPKIASPSKSLAHSILTDDNIKNKALENTIIFAHQYHLNGFNLDFENLAPEDRNHFTDFIRQLADKLHEANKLLYVSLPAKTREDMTHTWSGAFDYRNLGLNSDFVVVMAYSESWPGGPPGPLASSSYIKKVAQFSSEKIAADKIIFGLPVYGLRWREKEKAIPTSFSEITKITQDYGLKAKSKIKGAKQIVFYANGIKNEIWYEDAETLEDKLRLISQYHFKGIGLWSLGREEEKFWLLLDN